MGTKFKSLDTFYIIGIASDYQSGNIVMGRYIDPCVVDAILQKHSFMPCNTCGNMEIFTTNPNIKAKTEWEEVILIDDEEIREEQEQISCHTHGELVNGVLTGKTTEEQSPTSYTLFDYVFGECSDYKGLADADWSSSAISCSWDCFCDDDVSKALSDFLENQPSEDDINEYTRLKAKLGI